MLQRQIWAAQRFHPRSARCLHQSLVGPEHRETRQLRNKLSVTNNSSIPSDRCRYHSKRSDLTTKTNTYAVHLPSSRTREPWVYPNSLSDTLEAHRQANRDGIARDGVLIKRRRRPHESKKSTTSTGPWVGLKVLHVSLPAAATHLRSTSRNECPPLRSEWRPSSSLSARLRYPWVSRMQYEANKSLAIPAISRLNDELKACDKYFSAAHHERAAAHRAFAEIHAIVRYKVGQDTPISLIGSRAAETDGPLSDIDLNVNFPIDATNAEDSRTVKQQLRSLDRYLRGRNFRDVIIPHTYVDKTRVPIVSGTHIPSGLEFQVQSTVSSFDTLEVTKAFIAEFSSARVLFHIVKQMLMVRGLDKAVLGGISSYPLLNMVVTSLKLAGSNIAVDDTAAQLLHFLDFWSRFDFHSHGISLTTNDSTQAVQEGVHRAIDPISSIPRIVSLHGRATTDTDRMSHEDPADPMNNLGRSTYRITNVQACFLEARNRIRSSMQEWESAISRDIAVKDRQPLLAWCLGADYTSFEEARWKLETYSRQISDQSSSSKV